MASDFDFFDPAFQRDVHPHFARRSGYDGEVRVVGDALAPRWLEMAIHSGHHAALEV